MQDEAFLNFLHRKKHFSYNPTSNIPYEIQKLEQERIFSSIEFVEYLYEDETELNIHDAGRLLYHGIRFQKYLEKLENIFKEKYLYAGHYMNYDYMCSSDNCNKGEYVSLMSGIDYDTLEFETFILPNITLVVSPYVEAQLAQYVSFETWLDIQKNNYDLKHLYSYARGEYMVKKGIPIDKILAVGISTGHLRFNNQTYSDKILEDIKSLMIKYNVDLPIVETKQLNKILVPKKSID